MKCLWNAFERLVITLQCKNLKSYRDYKAEQNRRLKEGTPPLETMWHMPVIKWLWSRTQKQKTRLTTKEVSELYWNCLSKLVQVEDEITVSSPLLVRSVRVKLSGGTIVINDLCAINASGPEKLYVHMRKYKESDWFLVYRTYWVSIDVSWIQDLRGIEDDLGYATKAPL